MDIVRAWKDAAYRASLTEEQQNSLPENPIGGFELTDEEMAMANGAAACNAINSNALLCVQSLVLAVCNTMGGSCFDSISE